MNPGRGRLFGPAVQIGFDQPEDETDVNEHEDNADDHVFYGICGGKHVNGRVKVAEVLVGENGPELGFQVKGPALALAPPVDFNAANYSQDQRIKKADKAKNFKITQKFVYIHNDS